MEVEVELVVVSATATELSSVRHHSIHTSAAAPAHRQRDGRRRRRRMLHWYAIK